MFQSILVPLHGTASDSRALGTAYAFAREFDAHIDGLHIRPDPAAVAIRTVGAYDLGAGAPGLITAPMMDAIQAEIADAAQSARQSFDRLAGGHDITLAVRPGPQDRVTASFHDIEGNPRRDRADAARVHALTVCAPPDADAEFDVDAMSELLVRSGRPLLLAPSQPPARLGRTIAIAWNDSAESARAVAIAMPLLAAAEKIAIVTVSEGPTTGASAEAAAVRLADQLRWCGIDVQTRCVPAAPSATLSLFDSATAFGADLLVMGAYGHSRAREYILGGFTRTVLCGVDLPVFLVH